MKTLPPALLPALLSSASLLSSCTGLSYVPDGKDSLNPATDSGTTADDDTSVPIDSENHDDNERPIADAGPDQTVSPRSFVVLNGGGSSDPEDDPLTFAWTLTRTPGGSAASLLDDDRESPSFSPDLAGTYRIELIVNDGALDSRPDEVVVTVVEDNGVPTANAGPNQSVDVGDNVNLDGNGSSDPDGDRLSFTWTLASAPPGSSASLNNPSSATPRFTADVAGTYSVSLTVSDGSSTSSPDTINVTALESGGDTGNGSTTGCFGCSSRAGYDPIPAALFAWAVIQGIKPRRQREEG